MSQKHKTNRLDRRTFLAGAATAAVTIVRPSAVRGSQANSMLELGMIGCGGRGNWIAERFVKNIPAKFVACTDYYPERAEAFGEKYEVEPSRRFSTLSGHKKVLDGKVDAVVIESPPYFHPGHAADAVDADKHVFLAKPIAVDAPGCLSILDSGQRAGKKKKVFLIDFQTRANEYYRELARRVHRGDIGKLVTVEARYPWNGGNPPAPEKPEDRLRRWYCFREISGDFIVEQSIHAIDVASWLINDDPIHAVGTGGSKGLRGYGNIWDHFNVIYTFPKDVVMSFFSVQVIPSAPSEIACRAFGSKGFAETNYYTHASIHGENPYPGGACKDMYEAGAVTNIKEFYQFVTEGKHDNPTVAPSVRSNLTTILGRNAGYKGGLLTWKEMMDANERMEVDLSPFKS